ncbi:hypothetical protein Tco_0728457 [Tanacetum coccineum]|uniref:RNA-directed DNA polymerase, eukaryota, reverse transcriptase zinc-binding domain protein n=1 Tax=Tanacetum coccineum TaxID=301880 RepID=A0ABQ4YM81_9ASTR
MSHCDRGGRILLGWDQRVVNAMIIHMTHQFLFCLIEPVNRNFKIFAASFMQRIVVKTEGSYGGSYEGIWSYKKGSIMLMLFFLPYVSYDHCPAILVVPNEIEKKQKSFRFINYIADKEDFIPNVCKGWSTEVHKDPANSDLKKSDSDMLKKFNEIVMDDEKLLYQKAKVDWLCVGDKNSAYFHRVIRSKINMNMVDSIIDEHGRRYTGEEVPPILSKHFKKFLGKEVPTICR